MKALLQLRIGYRPLLQPKRYTSLQRIVNMNVTPRLEESICWEWGARANVLLVTHNVVAPAGEVIIGLEPEYYASQGLYQQRLNSLLECGWEVVGE